MTGDAWVTAVIGASGVVAIVGIALVLRSIRPAPSPSRGGDPGRSDRGAPPASTSGTPGRGWVFRSFGPWRRSRGVEHNLERAFARIDSVDPYAMQRRIGSALAETGLLSQTPAERAPARPRTAWPFGDPQHGRDEE